MATTFYLNLNYVCNERCVFCATDLTNNFRVPGRRPWVTLAEIRAWVGDQPPGPADQVLLAGGEPTLHQELLPIVRYFRATCPNVTMFSNGLRLADPQFAHDVLAAGVTRVAIALFGASAAPHEAVTGVRGSFERTLRALSTLGGLRRERDFFLGVRLLVSRQSYRENPAIVRLVRERSPNVSAVSLTRLQLSENAARAEAAVSWAEARASINEAARLVHEAGYQLLFDTLPLCVFEGENAAYVRAELVRRAARVAAGLEPGRRAMRYLDATVPAGRALPHEYGQRPLLPEPCQVCDYFSRCRRVESWEIERFGLAGLRAVRITDPLGAPAEPVGARSETES